MTRVGMGLSFVFLAAALKISRWLNIQYLSIVIGW